jgi:calcineurin-like phosphoesterase family protein
MAKVFFTSDTHFNHANIISYCSRPFSSADEMNREIIARWNAVVGPEDTVYHLGDFAMGRPFEMPAPGMDYQCRCGCLGFHSADNR